MLMGSICRGDDFRGVPSQKQAFGSMQVSKGMLMESELCATGTKM